MSSPNFLLHLQKLHVLQVTNRLWKSRVTILNGELFVLKQSCPKMLIKPTCSSLKHICQCLQHRDSSDAGGALSQPIQPQPRALSPAGDTTVPQLSKREKFNKRYKVSESTDNEVLSTFTYLLSYFFFAYHWNSF